MKLSITALSLLITFNISAAKQDFSLTIYDTYEAYKAKNGRSLFEFIGYDWTMGSLHVFYRVKKRNEGKEKVTTAWGFSVGDQLYRIVKGRPYRVLLEGKAVYYENGIAHLDMLIEDEGSAEVELGGWSFLSNSLTSEIIEFPSSKAEKEFKENGSLAPLFECVEKLRKKKTEKIRNCVKANI